MGNIATGVDIGKRFIHYLQGLLYADVLRLGYGFWREVSDALGRWFLSSASDLGAKVSFQSLSHKVVDSYQVITSQRSAGG